MVVIVASRKQSCTFVIYVVQLGLTKQTKNPSYFKSLTIITLRLLLHMFHKKIRVKR